LEDTGKEVVRMRDINGRLAGENVLLRKDVDK